MPEYNTKHAHYTNVKPERNYFPLFVWLGVKNQLSIYPIVGWFITQKVSPFSIALIKIANKFRDAGTIDRFDLAFQYIFC